MATTPPPTFQPSPDDVEREKAARNPIPVGFMENESTTGTPTPAQAEVLAEATTTPPFVAEESRMKTILKAGEKAAAIGGPTPEAFKK